MFTNFNDNVPPFMNTDQDSVIDIDNNSGNIEIDVNQDQNVMNNGSMSTPMMGGVSSPIIEPMRERVVNRTIEHIVPQPCPFM